MCRFELVFWLYWKYEEKKLREQVTVGDTNVLQGSVSLITSEFEARVDIKG